MNLIQGNMSNISGRFTILASRFNGTIVGSLIDGATDILDRYGISNDSVTLVRVPGAYELPLAAMAIAEKGDVDAIIALGAIIKGGTAHNDLIASECIAGLGRVQLETGIPIALGVLTVNNIEQAIERAGTKSGNRGADAAIVALEMVSLLASIGD